VPIIPLLQAISGTRLSTPAAIISYQASQPVTPTLDNSGSITGVDSPSAEAPAIPLIRTISGSPGAPNVIEGEHGKEHIIKVGDLPQRVPEMHPMRGSVFFNAADDSQIIVRGFYYPQAGPDAFFWAGEDEPGCSEESIAGRNYLLAPGIVGSRDYYNQDQPILPPYSGTEGDIVLTLPPGVSARNLKWICVWCRKFAQNFGTLKIKTE